VSRPIVAVYADGGCIGPNPSRVGLTWAWVHVAAGEQRVAQDSGVLAGPGTNQVAEYAAVVLALEALPAGWRGILATDSRTTMGRICLEWQEGPSRTYRQPQRWGCRGIPAEWQDRADAALARLGPITGRLLAGHPSQAALAQGRHLRSGLTVSRHNIYCDALAHQAGVAYRNRAALNRAATHPKGSAA
jgi:ribonuclease HI